MKQILHHDRSVKWKIFGSLLIFIGLIILVLWLFQVFFLERFYMFTKEKAVKKAANEINEVISSIDNSDLQRLKESISDVEAIGNENGLCLSLYINQNKKAIYTYEGNDALQCGISAFDINSNEEFIASLQRKAQQNNGTASALIDSKKKDTLTPALGNHLVLNENGNVYIEKSEVLDFFRKPTKEEQSMTYVSAVVGKYSTMYTVVVNAILTPVNATIDTIKTQFIIIALILIFIAVILAVYLSKKIASPIITINESAKKLAEGTYDIRFNGEGYKEIEELNDTLNYASKELSKVENLRKELIANMSHDLRTPLTMISGYGEVMRDIPGENNTENIQVIIEEANRLTNLVNDMLDLSKLQAGVMKLNPERMELTREIKHILHRYDKLLENDHLNIEFIYDDEVSIYADAVKMSQVIYNLMNNAINYSKEDKKIEIRQTVANQKVLIEVVDHGEGIEEEQLPYIWERYYKVDKTHIRSKVGSGIGLSIVKAVLELHKAEYGVRSVLGKGTTFWFKLPLYAEEKIQEEGRL